MRWCSFITPAVGQVGGTPAAAGDSPRLGAVVELDGADRVLDVAAWARSRGGHAPADLVDLVESSPATQARVTDLVRSAEADSVGWVRLPEVRFLAPVRQPNSLRDFMAFRDHVERGAARRGGTVSPAWDRIPVFYKGNRRSIVSPDHEVRWPSYTEKLDYECEVAAVLGRGGRDWTPDEAAGAVFGYAVMNDWSARDVQRDELSCWLGPAKAKDFATSIGPYLVTPDEWDPEVPHAAEVSVDGEVWSTGSTGGRRWTFGEMIAWAARDEDVYATDLIGSGTFGGGCGLDLDRWIQPGSEVQVTVEGLGTLTNRVVRPQPGVA